jgi:hypothetical protein
MLERSQLNEEEVNDCSCDVCCISH